MKQRKWGAKITAIVVLDGFKGKPVATICQDYQISEAQYYRWPNQFLANAPKTFMVARQTEREARLGDHRKAKCVCRAAHSDPESRASVLGLSAHLGLPVVCGRAADQQERV